MNACCQDLACQALCWAGANPIPATVTACFLAACGSLLLVWLLDTVRVVLRGYPPRRPEPSPAATYRQASPPDCRHEDSTDGVCHRRPSCETTGQCQAHIARLNALALKGFDAQEDTPCSN